MSEYQRYKESKGGARIEATYRLCLTGTPIMRREKNHSIEGGRRYIIWTRGADSFSIDVTIITRCYLPTNQLSFPRLPCHNIQAPLLDGDKHV
jgi:hypothetical protein